MWNVKIKGCENPKLIKAASALSACAIYYRRKFKPVRKFGIWRHVAEKHTFGVYALDKFQKENLIVELECTPAQMTAWVDKEVD